MDSNSQTININMSAEQKLDHIFNSMKEIKSSVLNLNSTVEELKNEQIILKSSLNNKIKEVCREILSAPMNNQQLSNTTNSQHNLNIENNRDTFMNIKSNNNPNRRKGIYGSNESSKFKTGIVPFNVYVGNVHLDTKDEEVTQLFYNNGTVKTG